jgi:hypothetical protein
LSHIYVNNFNLKERGREEGRKEGGGIAMGRTNKRAGKGIRKKGLKEISIQKV